jgi:membrane protein implicated in regulation of membrane protease activity
MLWAQWWVWAVAGLVLGVLEVALPGQILLGFGIGALATAAVVFAAGPEAVPGLPVLLVIFAAASGLAWIALRRAFAARRGQVKIWERDINDN